MLSENDQIMFNESCTMNKDFVIITKKLKLKLIETETKELRYRYIYWIDAKTAKELLKYNPK